MKKKIQLFLLFIFSVSLGAAEFDPKKPIYICTAADADHFNWMLSLIGSIHHFDFKALGQIAVFDLGFTQEQREELKHIQKLKVYDVELTHPDLLKHFVVRPGRKARGWYAWKPVVIKQALDLFPYVLYVDSGVFVKNSLAPIFDHMLYNGHFFVTCFHSIKWMTPQYVIKKFDLEDPQRAFVLEDTAYGLSAGIQGVTRSVYDSYVMPMYELSKDINNFIDDGTAPEGFGTARNDQTLFSIQARLQHLPILKHVDFLIDERQQTRFVFGSFFKLRFNRTDKQPEILQQSVRYHPNYKSKFAYKTVSKPRR